MSRGKILNFKGEEAESVRKQTNDNEMNKNNSRHLHREPHK